MRQKTTALIGWPDSLLLCMRHLASGSLMAGLQSASKTSQLGLAVVKALQQLLMGMPIMDSIHHHQGDNPQLGSRAAEVALRLGLWLSA